MEKLERLAFEMCAFDAGDPARIQHFIKVHSLSRLIGRAEGLPPEQLYTLEAAALVHDIGIRPAEQRYGHCTGRLQEELGPDYAREMLTGLGFAAGVIDRVCYLVGHHHTYTDVDGTDYRILLEADFLVNLFEGQAKPEAIRSARESIFRTGAGLRLLDAMFPAE